MTSSVMTAQLSADYFYFAKLVLFHFMSLNANIERFRQTLALTQTSSHCIFDGSQCSQQRRVIRAGLAKRVSFKK